MNSSPDLRAVGSKTADALRRRLRIDVRSLAALRVGLGVLVLADLALRSRNLGAFYTDAGILPRTALASRDPLHWSLHAVSGDVRVQALLFLVAGVFAVALTVGYRTSLATVGSWLFLVSLHNRMPTVLNGGDVLLRLLLFWGIFLPLGARWSVDSRQGPRRRPGAHVASVASAALLVQVVLVYSTNAALKLSGDLWIRGDGLEYVFSLGQFTVLLGDHLGAYPALLSVLDYLWLGTIGLSVLLIVLPGLARVGFATHLAVMHLGMLVTMRIGLFPLVSVVALLPFLPAAFWDRVASRHGVRRAAGAAGRLTERLAGVLPAAATPNSPPHLRRWTARLGTVVPLFFLVLVVLWNVQFLGYSEVFEREVVPEPVEPAIELTRTDQYWDMFAPDPLSTDGWIVAPGRLENGSRIDAFHGGPVRWGRPADVSATYPTARWRKYLVGLWRYDTADRRYFAEYLCRRWNTRHGTDLENVSVYFVEQPTRIDADREPTRRVRLTTERCGS